jgi:hypothetical protein
MKNLFQLKNRLAWEIQALACKPTRGDTGLRRRIDDRIDKLTELDKARVAIKKLGRLLPRLDTIQREAAKRDLRMMHRRARELRFELAL